MASRLPRAPEALLFDLGGVLIDIDFGRAIAAWAPYSALPADVLRRSFRHDLQYERHERGEISAPQYFDHLAASLKLDASTEQIEAGWNAIFVGEFVLARQWVEAIKGVLPCHAFSNTNASHMSVWSQRFPRVVDAFDRIFVSHQLGLRKPERAAFDRVCALIGKAADSVLFFDDLADNVQAARDAGLQAVWVRSPDDVATALQSLGHAPFCTKAWSDGKPHD
jgi:FMN phosphatase YigB (HAD superfamily)